MGISIPSSRLWLYGWYVHYSSDLSLHCYSISDQASLLYSFVFILCVRLYNCCLLGFSAPAVPIKMNRQVYWAAPRLTWHHATGFCSTYKNTKLHHVAGTTVISPTVHGSIYARFHLLGYTFFLLHEDSVSNDTLHGSLHQQRVCEWRNEIKHCKERWLKV